MIVAPDRRTPERPEKTFRSTMAEGYPVAAGAAGRGAIRVRMHFANVAA